MANNRISTFSLVVILVVVGPIASATLMIGVGMITHQYGPWLQAFVPDALSLVFLAGLAFLILRPRSRNADWKLQVGIGVALVAALLWALAHFAPSPAGAPATAAAHSFGSPVYLVVGLGGVMWILSTLFGGRIDIAGILGSARFGAAKDIAAMAKSGAAGGGLIIGRSKRGKLLRYDGPAHLLTIAPTRSGKGVGTIIPNLLTARRSIVCIDPKGENARVAGRQRETLGPVWYLDPFDLSGRPAAKYNPLDRLAPDSLDLAEDAMTLADALVFDQEVSDPHWNEEAKALIAGIILYTVCHDDPHLRTLATVRDYLTLAPTDFAALLQVMQASIEARGLIARAANRHLAKSDREAAGVLSSAQRHTHFLDSPRIAQVTGGSDFNFAQLKEQTATVFLILPPDRLDTYARWLRLLLAQSLSEMARSPARPPQPVLFLLDEFAALGKLQPIERAMGLMAGYGLQLWPILQDIHQLRSLYGSRAGTFLSNAGVLQAFGVNDYETAEILSKTMGRMTIDYATQGQSSTSSAPFKGSYSDSTTQHLAARNLMDPDEIMKLDPARMLLMMVGKDPLILRKVRYYEEREFAGSFDPA